MSSSNENDPTRSKPPILNQAEIADSHHEMGDDPVVRMLIPVGLSGWAIASGYLGLFSVLLLPAPLALATGILAIRHMRRNPRKHGMGRTVFGIIMGGLGSILLIAVVVSMLAPLFR